MGEATTQLWSAVPRGRKRQVEEVAKQYDVSISTVVNRALDFYFTEKLDLEPLESTSLP